MTTIAINGFGRIGRHVLRVLIERGLLGTVVRVVAVGDPNPADNLAYLLKYDSTQGRFQGTVSSQKSVPDEEFDDVLVVNGHEIRVVKGRTPTELPWRELGVKIVIEATGLFNDAEKAKGHVTAGAKKVIICGAARGADVMIVQGVNDDNYDPAHHNLISASLPSTHSIAPLVHVLLKEGIGIEQGFLTTIRATYETQKTVDSPSRSAWREGRAAGLNLIPSPSGVARSVALVAPQVHGRLHGIAFLTPCPVGSVSDFTFSSERETSYAEICAAMKRASETYLRGILDYTEDQVASSDFIHCPASAVFDAGSGIELNSRFFKLVAWYDNEWGYACRVTDLLQHVVERGM